MAERQSPVFEQLTTITDQRLNDFVLLAGQLSSSFRGVDPNEAKHTIARNLEEALENPDETAVFIHEDNGRIVSTATANVLGTDGWVDDVVTLEEMEGRGLATAVMRTMHSWMYERGATRSLLTSKPDRVKAGVLYGERLGYILGGSVYRSELSDADPHSTLARATFVKNMSKLVESAKGQTDQGVNFTAVSGVAKILTGDKAWVRVENDMDSIFASEIAIAVGGAMLQLRGVSSANMYFLPGSNASEGLQTALPYHGYEQRDTRLYSLDLT